MVPDRDWSWVRRHPLRPTPAEIRAARKPLEPFDGAELVQAALAECDAAEAETPTPRSARRFRDGLLLALATYVGIRRRNLAEITIGEHLVASGSGYRLVFEEAGTKTGAICDLRVPDMLVPYLQAYLDRYRPVLLDGTDDHGRLWVNIGGEPLAYEALYGLFARKAQKLIGRPINPHLTRHSLATTILTSDPRAIATAAAALTHRGTRSVSEVYDRSGRTGAEAEWQRILRRLRAQRGRA